MNRYRNLVLVAAIALPCACGAQSPNEAFMTNHDVFDLVCSDATNADRRALHIDVDAQGQFDVSVVDGGEPTSVAARTYTNAVTWTEGSDRWTLDRFMGTLVSRTAHRQLACDRVGGRRF